MRFWYRFIDFIKYPNYYFFSRIRSVWNWLPVIWKDRNFDYAYLEIILHHKIKMMSKHFNENNKYFNVRDDLKYMSIVEKLLKNRIDDVYDNEAYDNIQKKLGESSFEFTKLDEKYKGEELYSLDILHKEKKITEEENEWKFEQYKAADLKNEKAKKIIYKILNEKSCGWWI